MLKFDNFGIKVNLTITSLQLAVCALYSEMKKYELMTHTEHASEEDISEWGEYALDLSRALSELGTAYEDARKAYPEFPSYEKLTANREK